MKKIISLLLATVCLFALFSCGGDSQMATITNIVSASEPTKIITNTFYSDGENDFAGYYETQIFGTDFTMYYNYKDYAVPAPGADPSDSIATHEDTIYYHNGRYSTDDGATWTTDIPSETARQVKFDLGAADIKDYTLSEDEKTLTFTVSAEDAEKILGVKLSATEAGVEIEVIHDGKNLRQVKVSYSTEYATLVTIQTSYSYGTVTSPFGDGAAE